MRYFIILICALTTVQGISKELKTIFASEQKIIYGTNWEVNEGWKTALKSHMHNIDFMKEAIKTKNEAWLRSLENKSQMSQAEFLEYLINIPKAHIITPNSIQPLNNEDFCWVIMVLDSRDTIDRIGTTSLLRSANEMFYERCGFGILDISFPSNYLMISKIQNLKKSRTKTFPFILFKKPYTPKRFIMEASDGIQSLMKLENWGVRYEKDILNLDPLLAFDHILEFYEKMSPNLKLMSIYMPHYKPNKQFMQSSIKKIIEVMQSEAIQKARDVITCGKTKECSDDELFEQAEESEKIYEETYNNNLDHEWNLTEVLTIKINAIPHVYSKEKWEQIKNEFIHLTPRTPKHLHLSLADWKNTRNLHSEL